MGKFDTDYSTFGHGKKVDQERVVDALTWAEEYVTIYSDSFVESVYEKTLMSRFLKDSHLEGIEKRMNNVPLDPKDYLDKFRRIVLKLIALNEKKFGIFASSRFTMDDQDASRSLLENFKKWIYLTDKQIKFVNFLFSKKFAGNKGRVENEMKVKFRQDEIDFVLNTHIKKDFEKTKGGFTAEKFAKSEEKAKEKAQKKKRKEIKKRSFLTLNEVREKYMA